MQPEATVEKQQQQQQKGERPLYHREFDSSWRSRGLSVLCFARVSLRSSSSSSLAPRSV